MLQRFDMRLERATFGRVLRAARERRGISLHQLAEDTKVSVDLWKDLEQSDFSRWPARVYARTYIREYAAKVGLDPETIVNEFCRLFPEQGDRRAEGLLRAHAAIVQHNLDWEDEPPRTKDRRNRRATDPSAPPRGWFGRRADRLFALAIDVAIPLGFSLILRLAQLPFWPTLAISALVYPAIGTLLLGNSLGTMASVWTAKTLRLKPAARRLMSRRLEVS